MDVITARRHEATAPGATRRRREIQADRSADRVEEVHRAAPEAEVRTEAADDNTFDIRPKFKYTHQYQLFFPTILAKERYEKTFIHSYRIRRSGHIHGTGGSRCGKLIAV